MMALRVTGDDGVEVEYENFVSASVTQRLDSLAKTFTFEATAKKGSALPFSGGETCRVIVDGEMVLSGRVETIQESYSDSDHSLVISGRNGTADLIDSTLDKGSDLRGQSLTLKAIIEKQIEYLGLDIGVVDEVNPRVFSVGEDIVSPEPGDSVFSLIESYAKKRQVLLTSDSDSNVVITANSGISGNGVLQHIIDSDTNNVISASFSIDRSKRYNSYKVASSLNPIPLNSSGSADLKQLVNQSSEILDGDISPTRRLVIVAGNMFSTDECRRRAQWEADVRRSRGLVYTANVSGFRTNGFSGDLWRINRLYQVVDEFVGKVETMLCNSVTFNFDSESGSSTDMTLVGKNAYTLFLEDDSVTEVGQNV